MGLFICIVFKPEVDLGQHDRFPHPGQRWHSKLSRTESEKQRWAKFSPCKERRLNLKGQRLPCLNLSSGFFLGGVDSGYTYFQLFLGYDLEIYVKGGNITRRRKMRREEVWRRSPMQQKHLSDLSWRRPLRTNIHFNRCTRHYPQLTGMETVDNGAKQSRNAKPSVCGNSAQSSNVFEDTPIENSVIGVTTQPS